ncbi:hypothetical protein EDB87DRAFT_1714195 [Lactarius vividus]|nr:hypothetical protein EDB87DRAFT_1714195 [Lactarius vividus]
MSVACAITRRVNRMGGNGGIFKIIDYSMAQLHSLLEQPQRPVRESIYPNLRGPSRAEFLGGSPSTRAQYNGNWLIKTDFEAPVAFGHLPSPLIPHTCFLLLRGRKAQTPPDEVHWLISLERPGEAAKPKWKKVSTTLVPMDRYLLISTSPTRGRQDLDNSFAPVQKKVPRSVVVGKGIPRPRVGVIVTQSVHTQARTAITNIIPNSLVKLLRINGQNSGRSELHASVGCRKCLLACMSPLKGNYPVAASLDA